MFKLQTYLYQIYSSNDLTLKGRVKAPDTGFVGKQAHDVSFLHKLTPCIGNILYALDLGGKIGMETPP